MSENDWRRYCKTSARDAAEAYSELTGLLSYGEQPISYRGQMWWSRKRRSAATSSLYNRKIGVMSGIDVKSGVDHETGRA